ncbi:aminoglycoside phosphotransferase [Sphingomonas sp. KC8]|nr:aminoglycoside phosphotransferase [Sphingomonas sp. KC8]
MTPDYGAAGEERMRAFVEAQTGGRIIRMERQTRWRPAWFVDVERDGEILHLHLRGDREGDVSIFPELKREADVMSVLGNHGIPVPRIHGYCADPPAILMDALPGSRNVADAASDSQRQAIARDYMAAVVAMHQVPVEAFAEKGIAVPEGAEAIALAGLNAYLPHYRRTKSKPEPMLEFVIGWIRRNVPRHRSIPSFIQFDSGQFLFEDGRMTGLYDFEFSMIGDPMVDLATMRMRDSYEPLGDELRTLCGHYEAFSGQKVDHAVIDYHTLQFATLGTMQFAGTVGEPQPGDPHAVYLEFDLALRQTILLAMAALTGVTLEEEPPLTPRSGDNEALIAKLADTVAGIEGASDMDRSRKDFAVQLLEWVARSDAMGAEVAARNLADVGALLGQDFGSWFEAETALETFVLDAGPDQDERLLRLFCAIEARRMLLFGPTRIGQSASHVCLPPTR